MTERAYDRDGDPTGPPAEPAGAEESTIIPPMGRPRVGQVLFGRYRVERCLGEGGMGSVWLVQHLLFEVPRALKLIASDIAADPEIRARFRREARVMARLVHPNAVAIHEARLGEEGAFIEMEYVEGESLSSLLRRGPMPLPRVEALLAQLCEVLGAAHALGVVHRDLKPSNLMIASDRETLGDLLKVLDFGIAKVLHRDGDTDDVQTRANLFLGTPHYASPEQIRGSGVDSRSDLYSAGVILYEMLAGRRPFVGSGAALIRAQMTAPPPPFSSLDGPPRVPQAVERVVMRCLAKSPEDRPQTARELIDAFHVALDATTRDEPLPLHASPPWPPPTPPTTPPTSRSAPQVDPWDPGRLRPAHRAVILGLPALALAVVVLAAWVRTWRGGAAPAPASSPATIGPAAGPRPRFELGAAAKRLLSTWRREGFEPSTVEGDVAGWPRVLARTGDLSASHRYRFGPSGHYLPVGYRAEGPGSAADGWPRVVVREEDGTRFLRIEGGRFVMGRRDGDPARREARDRPPHDVILSGFYLQETEVTRGEIARSRPVASPKGGRPPGAAEDSLHPAASVSHRAAEAFAAARGGALPTEAQWEFAARSRSSEAMAYVWSWNPDLADRDPILGGLAQVNRGEAGHLPTCPVDRFRSTDITRQGVVDLAGNVREWCRDVYAPYAAVEPPPRDPCNRDRLGPTDAFVVRGGAYSSIDPEALRTTARDRAPGPDEQSDVGFRLVLEAPVSPGVPPTGPP